MNSLAPLRSTERPPIHAMPATRPACSAVSGMMSANGMGAAPMPAQTAAVACVSVVASSSCTARACVARASSARPASGRCRKSVSGEVVDAPALVGAERAVGSSTTCTTDDAERRDEARAQLVARVDLARERVLGRASTCALLLVDVVRRLSRRPACRRVAFGSSRVAVGDDGDERRLEAVGAADLVVDVLERVEVGVDGRVDLARLGDEDDDVGRLRAAARRRSTRARSSRRRPRPGPSPPACRACRGSTSPRRRARSGTSGRVPSAPSRARARPPSRRRAR